MATKQRNQNPLVGDTVVLKFFAFGNGSLADPHAIEKVDIYRVLGTEVTEENPLGRVLVETITSDDIVRDEEGKYHADLVLERPRYTQGRYQDEWTVVFEEDAEPATPALDFFIAPTTWFVDSSPVVFDFNFDFRPNRVRKGSKKHLQVKVTPDVPRGTDKQRYYENMAIAGSIYITIEQKCGNCLPQEEDLRIVVDQELLTERDGCNAFYLLDTEELDCGLYDVTVEAHLGENVFVSDPMPLQIY